MSDLGSQHEVRAVNRSAEAPVRVAIIGVHGYGAAHVLRAQELAAAGRIELVGLVDPVDGPIVREGKLLTGGLPPIEADIDDVLARTEVDVVVVSTPLHTHAALASRALRAGADVLLEKPPVTDMAAFDELREVQRETGRLVQVGFQSLGSLALAELRRMIDDGELGQVEAISAHGSWTRDRAYWTRAAWAGRRELNGVRISDGAISNPFAHAVMTSLRIAGIDTAAQLGSVEADLYCVNPIAVDDTATLRVRPAASGAAITCAFTLAGPAEDLPFITVRGSQATAQLQYTEDVLTVDGAARRFGRIDLMENLLDARAGRAALLSPLERAGAFVSIIEQVAQTPVRTIAAEHAERVGEGLGEHPVIIGIDAVLREACERGVLFRELEDVPWSN